MLLIAVNIPAGLIETDCYNQTNVVKVRDSNYRNALEGVLQFLLPVKILHKYFVWLYLPFETEQYRKWQLFPMNYNEPTAYCQNQKALLHLPTIAVRNWQLYGFLCGDAIFEVFLSQTLYF